MKTLRFVAVALFVAAVPSVIMATNVRWVINAPLFYSYGFDKYDIPDRTGLQRDQLLSAARQIRDYFNNSQEFLNVSVVRAGVLVPNLYNQREVLHMRDVKNLARGTYRVQEAAGAYMAAFVLVGLLMRGRGFLPLLAKLAALGGASTLGLVVLVGLGSLVSFDRLFHVFHLVSFSNDLWQLDPSRDYLIAMFPEGFFFDATMWIAGATVVEALLLSVGALALLRWRPQWIGRWAQRLPQVHWPNRVGTG